MNLIRSSFAAAIVLGSLMFPGCNVRSPSAAPDVSDPSALSIAGNIVLGAPTATSIKINLLSPDQDGAAYLAYGNSPDVYEQQTVTVALVAGKPLELIIKGLRSNEQYYYRLYFQATGNSIFEPTAEYRFHTARPTGSTFSFGVQGDSHPEREGKMYNPELYALNMRNVAARQPDFYFGLGDDFSIEGLIEKNILTQENVDQVYQKQRAFFGIMGNSTAVFLVNGNHEQAAGYLLSDRYQTPYRNAPIFAGKARVTFFPLPVADGFYSVDAMEVPEVGLIRDYYAWEWGDALFVVIDPYWHSPVPVDTGVPGIEKSQDGWESTMGDIQYAWFKKILEESSAKYKFVFEHHVLGNGRGAAGIAHSYEWGGYNSKGTAYEFPSRRPGWSKPIHQLMDENNVTIFFFGHDHLFARERVDGIVYQSVPNPADDTYTAFNADAYDPGMITFPGAEYDPGYGVIMPNSGYLRVTVSPEKVRVEYVRAWLPKDATGGHPNGEVAFAYEIPAGN
jgi:hypothetical protein